MRPIGKTTTSKVEKKRRRARRIADGSRELLELYERAESIRQHGGSTLDELTKKIQARATAKRRRRQAR
jgi:hypothetical protein